MIKYKQIVATAPPPSAHDSLASLHTHADTTHSHSPGGSDWRSLRAFSASFTHRVYRYCTKHHSECDVRRSSKRRLAVIANVHKHARAAITSHTPVSIGS
jgi:hypothetical protein